MRRTLVIVLGIALFGAVAHAYTPDERKYCGPEAYRLCTLTDRLAAGLGDYTPIETCFKKHRRELARSCVDAIRKSFGK